MLSTKTSVDLTPQEIELIEAALHTQEKILAVQSRAETGAAAAGRLSQLQAVLRNLRRQSGVRQKCASVVCVARSFLRMRSA